MPRPPAIATLPLVLLIGLFWGLNWPAVKFMLTELPPLTVRALAFPCAAIFLAVIARALGHDLRLPKPERRPMAVTGLFLVFGFNALTSLGQMLVATSKAAIIAYTMPALTALLAGPILGERIGGRVFVALAIGMAGLAVLASENIAALIGDPLGPVIMLGAALSWALGNVALKARSWTLSPLAMTVWFFVVSTAAIWPLVLIFEPPWRQDWPSLPVLLTLGYHVLGPMVVCYAVWTVLLGRLPATMAAISVLTAPVVGVLSSVLLLGDRVSWQTVAALLLVVCSIALTLLPTRRKAG